MNEELGDSNGEEITSLTDISGGAFVFLDEDTLFRRSEEFYEEIMHKDDLAVGTTLHSLNVAPPDVVLFTIEKHATHETECDNDAILAESLQDSEYFDAEWVDQKSAGLLGEHDNDDVYSQKLSLPQASTHGGVSRLRGPHY